MCGRLLHAVTHEDGCVLDGKFISSPFYVLVILLLSLTWPPSIMQMFQKTKCKAEQLEEEASRRTMGARESGCCLHPQDDWTFCWEALHSAGALCHRPSWLDPAVGTNRGSRTLWWFYRKCDNREEALRAVWTIKPPDVSLHFLRFDRDTTSDSCCRCCPVQTSSCLGSSAGVRDK